MSNPIVEDVLCYNIRAWQVAWHVLCVANFILSACYKQHYNYEIRVVLHGIVKALKAFWVKSTWMMYFLELCKCILEFSVVLSHTGFVLPAFWNNAKWSMTWCSQSKGTFWNAAVHLLCWCCCLYVIFILIPRMTIFQEEKIYSCLFHFEVCECLTGNGISFPEYSIFKHFIS